MLSRREQMELVKQANDELTIRHTAPLPDSVNEKPAAAPVTAEQALYSREMNQKMFPRFIDDKDMGDSRISSSMLKVVGV